MEHLTYNALILYSCKSHRQLNNVSCSNLPPELFRTTTSLVTLLLQRNGIEELHPEQFASLTSLNNLSVGNPDANSNQAL